jgi:hypothetical protein
MVKGKQMAWRQRTDARVKYIEGPIKAIRWSLTLQSIKSLLNHDESK